MIVVYTFIHCCCKDEMNECLWVRYITSSKPFQHTVTPTYTDTCTYVYTYSISSNKRNTYSIQVL